MFFNQLDFEKKSRRRSRRDVEVRTAFMRLLRSANRRKKPSQAKQSRTMMPMTLAEIGL